MLNGIIEEQMAKLEAGCFLERVVRVGLPNKLMFEVSKWCDQLEIGYQTDVRASLKAQ